MGISSEQIRLTGMTFEGAARQSGGEVSNAAEMLAAGRPWWSTLQRTPEEREIAGWFFVRRGMAEAVLKLAFQINTGEFGQLGCTRDQGVRYSLTDPVAGEVRTGYLNAQFGLEHNITMNGETSGLEGREALDQIINDLGDCAVALKSVEQLCLS